MQDIPRDISPKEPATTASAVEPRRPPVPETDAGAARRVGVEIEFAGLDVPAAADLVRGQFGGAVTEEDPHRLVIADTRFGDFIVELDTRAVHKNNDGTDAVDDPLLPEDLDSAARDALGKALTGIVPVEIVTPPLPWPALGDLTALTADLRRAGAKGTDDNVLYAFGLHLNPEVPKTDAATILRHLKAYIVLADWLRAEIGVDLTRRLMPHADPFPRDYALKVLSPDYAPDLAAMIEDYLRHNPTRNRELDMLPLFRHLNEHAVTARLDDPLIKARPTFHYRLPDCALGNVAWSPVNEWNRWVKVEELAADRARLDQLARACRDNLLRPAPERWLEDLQAWLTA